MGLPWEPISLAQVVGGFATGLGVGVAVFAALYARSEVQSSKYASALKSFQHYQELAFKHLDLAEPNYQSLVTTGRTSEYRWFVGIFLTACEEIILHVGEKKYWVATIHAHILKHHEYLGSEVFQTKKLSHYAPKMQKIISAALKQGASNAQIET